MPETSDSQFTWFDFVRRNNNELVATYGNLANRVLSMVQRNFEGRVPTPGDLDAEDQALLDQARTHLNDTAAELEACRFRPALQSAMSLAQAANRYLDAQAPWRAVREDVRDAATTLWVALSVINCLKTMFAPFLPFSSQDLHAMLGLPGNVEDDGWAWTSDAIKPGASLPQPTPLFTKLDESIVEEETARLGN
jgi:methionyl-tRNA synthetase